MFIHNPKNEIKADVLWAFLSMDDDGTEGICSVGINGPNGISHTPMVFIHRRTVDMMRPKITEMAQACHKRIRLVRFRREEVEESFVS